jgi:hypothetical protein
MSTAALIEINVRLVGAAMSGIAKTDPPPWLGCLKASGACAVEFRRYMEY